MKIINDINVSDAWLEAAKKYADDYDNQADYSCTGLINPPRLSFLRKRHDEEIVQPISDLVWIILGNACHNILDAASNDGSITEQRYEIKFLDRTIGFKPDRIEPMKDGKWHLKDFKITSVWQAVHNVKPEWIWQNSLYTHSANAELPVDIIKSSNELLLKDWKKSEALSHRVRGMTGQMNSVPNYPQHPIVQIPIPIKSKEETSAFLKKRLELFISCEDLEDDKLPLCSESERWATPDLYVVKKMTDGIPSKKAVPKGKFSYEHEAYAFIDAAKTKPSTKNNKYVCQFRPGVSKRCNEYCSVSKFCSQHLQASSNIKKHF